MNYFVVNGDKSQPYALIKELQNNNELENLRSELEQKHGCFKSIKHPGQSDEIKKVKEIIFIYRSVI